MSPSPSGKKRALASRDDADSPAAAAKRAKLLDGSDDDEEEDEGDKQPAGLRINAAYAARFEHNAKRRERERLEDKYGGGAEEESESSSETEDDEGALATEGLDVEIAATLEAIRKRDPRVFDKDAVFYSGGGGEGVGDGGADGGKEKPMFLRDYHRRNLVEGGGVEAQEEEEVAGFVSLAEKERVANEAVVREMHAVADAQRDSDDDNDEAFLVRKGEPEPVAPRVPVPRVEDAEADPDSFLSNFLASRAWRPLPGSFYQPFESDDEEHDARADAFEEAYNLRFEDPAHANEKLVTHSRAVAAQYSVRREDLSGRKKTREKQRERKEEARRVKRDEKARLRKLKIEEMEDKVKRIRKSAGLAAKQVDLEEWAGVLDEDWDDEKWELEMGRRFGKDYYDAPDDVAGSVEEVGAEGKARKKRKVRPPKWEDDIDIKDLVPDFDDGNEKLDFTPFDDEAGSDLDAGAGAEVVDASDDHPGRASNSKSRKKDRLREAAEKKRTARRDRQIIESIVDQKLDVEMALHEAPPPENAVANNSNNNTDAKPPAFRYRETSPMSFGLTSLDILNASDAQLNQFVGLKKLTAFRDPERKRRDKKKLGKKARLREWRLEVFRDEAEGQAGESSGRRSIADHGQPAEPNGVDGAAKGKKKKKKRKRSKAKQAAATVDA